MQSYEENFILQVLTELFYFPEVHFSCEKDIKGLRVKGNRLVLQAGLCNNEVVFARNSNCREYGLKGKRNGGRYCTVEKFV